MLYSYVFWPFF